MMFLTTGIVALSKGSPSAVPYKYQVWTQTWPFMFTALCIINILKYKLHLYYSFKQELAPKSVRAGLILLVVITVGLGVYFPIIDCDANLFDKLVYDLNISGAIVYLVVLSSISLFVASHLAKQLRL